MRTLRAVAAILLAIPLFVFGLNDFVGFFSLPEAGDSQGERLLLLMRDGGLMSAIAASHVIIALGLLIRRTRFAAAMLQLPMSVGIVAFHASMLPAGIAPAIVMFALNLGVLADPLVLRLFDPDAMFRDPEGP